MDHIRITHSKDSGSHAFQGKTACWRTPLRKFSLSLSLSLRSPLSFRGAGIGPSLLSDPWGTLMVQLAAVACSPDLPFTCPGNLQDVLLHETAVSWLRLRLTESTPARCWEGAPVQYTSRLKRCCDDVNQNLKVDDLCNAWPKRIRKVRDLEGGRLKS